MNRPIVRRGEIWFVRLDPTQGSEEQKTRRSVIVQRDPGGGNTTIVVPFTHSDGRQPSIIRPLIERGRGSGLSMDSLALCDQVRTVDRLRIENKVGELASPDMAAIEKGLFEILDLGNSETRSRS